MSKTIDELLVDVITLVKKLEAVHHLLEIARYEDRHKQIAVLQGIKLLASWHYDPEADFGDLSPDDKVAHINARIVWECNQALRELGVNLVKK